jgi:hypothetical protein
MPIGVGAKTRASSLMAAPFVSASSIARQSLSSSGDTV